MPARRLRRLLLLAPARGGGAGLHAALKLGGGREQGAGLGPVRGCGDCVCRARGADEDADEEAAVGGRREREEALLAAFVDAIRERVAKASECVRAADYAGAPVCLILAQYRAQAAAAEVPL